MPRIFGDRHDNVPSLSTPSTLPNKGNFLERAVSKLFHSIVEAVGPPLLSPSHLEGGGAILLAHTSQEDRKTWQNAYKSWKITHPGASEENFAAELLTTHGIDLKQPLRTFAAAIFLGNRESRQVKEGVGVTVMLSPPKEGRDVKIVIYSPKGVKLGDGGEAVVHECLVASEKVKGGILISTKPKKAVMRERIQIPEEHPDTVGNTTLKQMKSKIQGYIRQHGEPPPGVAMSAQRELVGIPKPLKILHSQIAYDTYREGGAMIDWVKKQPTVEQKLKLFEQAMRGFGVISFCHAEFRDFKLENILVSGNDQAVISDWSDVRMVEPMKEELSPQETLMLARHTPLHWLYTPSYNFYNDIEAIELHEEEVNQCIKDLNTALQFGESGIEESRNLRDAWNARVNVVQKHQSFQLGYALLSLLVPSDDIHQVFEYTQEGHIANLLSETDIDHLINPLALDPKKSKLIKTFLNSTLGKPTSSRLAYEDLWRIYESFAD